MSHQSTNHKLSTVQKELLKIYSVVKRLCEKHNISFYAIGGTALGAVRHQGFIPWDDDIDLGIPIDDYNKFIKICKKELPSPYVFESLHIFGGKIHNTNTTFLEAQCVFSHTTKCNGIYIDIFPLIGTPNNLAERNSFLEELHQYFIEAFVYDRYPNCSKFSKSKIDKWRNDILSRYDHSKSEYVTEFATGFDFIKKASGMDHPINMQFENTTVPVMSTYKEDFEIEYGDWHKLPPVNKRHTHDKYTLIDLKKPYSYYQEKISQIDPKILNFFKLKDEQEGHFFYDSKLLLLQHNQLIKQFEKQNQELSELRFNIKQIKDSRAYTIARKLQKLSAKIHRK